MRRERSKAKMPSKEGLASEDKIVQKGRGNYKSRYSSGMLAPESDIVQKAKPTYRSRYK